MDINLNRRRLVAAFGAFGVAIAAKGSAAAQLPAIFRPPCTSERGLAGWKVTAGVAKSSAAGLMIGKWEASRQFSADFGFRVALDTSEGADPFLLVWHNYKRGDFTMRLPDGTSFSAILKSANALTQLNVPPQIIAALRAAPVGIEHTSAGGKWDRYKTDGLPGAIVACEADLATLREQLDDRKCAAVK